MNRHQTANELHWSGKWEGEGEVERKSEYERERVEEQWKRYHHSLESAQRVITGTVPSSWLQMHTSEKGTLRGSGRNSAELSWWSSMGMGNCPGCTGSAERSRSRRWGMESVELADCAGSAGQCTTEGAAPWGQLQRRAEPLGAVLALGHPELLLQGSKATLSGHITLCFRP